MRLNLPHIPAFDKIERAILIGAGGGYDYLGTLAIRAGLTERWVNGYCYDLVKEVGSTGVQPIVQFLKKKVEEDTPQAIILVDGGVDVLMRGDEKGAGTLLEDAVTLAAVAQVDVPHKVIACMGFGAEAEEGLCHYRALENMAALTASGGFLGACALTPDMGAFHHYRRESEQAWAGKRKSHIHTRIIPAVTGQFGEQTLYEGVDARVCGAAKEVPSFVNPLMSLIWFFDLMKVYERNLFSKKLVPTATRTDSLMIYRQLLPDLMKDARDSLPIPL